MDRIYEQVGYLSLRAHHTHSDIMETAVFMSFFENFKNIFKNVSHLGARPVKSRSKGNAVVDMPPPPLTAPNYSSGTKSAICFLFVRLFYNRGYDNVCTA